MKQITFENMYLLIGTVLTFGYLALLLFLISRMKFFRVGNLPVRWFQGVFVLKVMSGFLLYLIYTYYYTDRSTADIWKYYDDGMVMYSALAQHPLHYFQMLFGIGNDAVQFQPYYDQMNHWYRPYGSSIANDTHTIIRFNAFVRMFSLGHYNVHSVVANFLGLVGLMGIFHFLRQMAPAKEKWFFAAVFLMPGMMFWASGVLKEPLLLFGLGLMLYGVQKLTDNGLSAVRLMFIAVSLFMLITVKSYALIAILPGLAAWLFYKRFSRIHPAIVFTGIYVLLALLVVAFTFLFPEKSPVERLAQKQYEFYQLADGGTYVQTAQGDTLYIYPKYYEALQFSEDKKLVQPKSEVGAVDWRKAKTLHEELILLNEKDELTVLLDYGKTGSTIDIPKLDSSIASVIKGSPAALTNALFRPYPWEVRSPFMALSGLENLIIAFLFVLMILFFRKEALYQPIFYITFFFALIILLLTGLVTPVVGAIVRYKVPALPFLVCGLLALIDTERIETIITKFFKKSVV